MHALCGGSEALGDHREGAEALFGGEFVTLAR
jgi:hypothetical protein